MDFNNRNTKNSTAITTVACAIVFILFSFVYLYFYQEDILAVTQHVLSKGATHYDRLIGASLITLLLQLLQGGVAVFGNLKGKYYALTYFPSLLILTIITDIGPEIDCSFSFGSWIWWGPLILVLWGGLVYILRNYQRYDKKVLSSGLLSQTTWVNMMFMTLMFLFVGMMSSGNAVFHYRMHIEKCLLEHDYDNALATGKKSQETDSVLTMLRFYTLAHENKLGDELFVYPVSGTSNDIIPSETGAHCIIYPNDSIYKFLGAKPAHPVMALPFLKRLVKCGLAKEPVKDYILCGYLIDRKLDDFVRCLTEFYEINDSLPKHYREALILYTHQRSNPIVVYHNVVMDTDFNDLQVLERKYNTYEARKRMVFNQYSGTYWWYYEYMSDKK